MADSVREGTAKRKQLHIEMVGEFPNKRDEKAKEKEKKRKGKFFNLQDLLSNDCDNIAGKKEGKDKAGEDKEFENFLMSINKKRVKTNHKG